FCIFITTDWKAMNSRNSFNGKPVGVIGIGSFGTVIANILAEKNKVVVYARKKEVVDEINQQHTAEGKKINPQIEATDDPQYICEKCDILFPMISSSGFKEVMINFAPF